MKWIFLLAALASIIPLSGWIRNNRHLTPKIWVLMGVLLFVIDPLHFYMALISWPFWPGFVTGFEVTIIDIIAVALYITLPPSNTSVPFRVAGGAYLASAGVFSAFQAGVPETTLFYAWQLVRMFFLFMVTTRACSNDERIAPALLKGMAIGICIELCTGLYQRFMIGEIQVGGTFGHQNSLGMATHFVVFPLVRASFSRQAGVGADRCIGRRRRHCLINGFARDVGAWRVWICHNVCNFRATRLDLP